MATGLGRIGFLFGSGTSVDSGYPLLPKLTVDVMSNLTSGQVDKLNDLVLREIGEEINLEAGEPNIEAISDVVEAAILTLNTTSPGYTECLQIRRDIRDGIVEVFESVDNPAIANHIRFFQAIKRLFAGRHEAVWIFTTNYDNLFEVAATIAMVPIVSGFLGNTLGYFHENTFGYIFGNAEKSRFIPLAYPIVRLVKLHGSLDWWRDQNDATGVTFCTQKPAQIPFDTDRVIVLPRKKKVTETLDTPFRELFRVAEQAIGGNCKYLVSCGFGFGDEHINEILLLPKLRQGRIRLTALVNDNSIVKPFEEFPSFFYSSESHTGIQGAAEIGTDLWQFDRFVNLFGEYTGV